MMHRNRSCLVVSSWLQRHIGVFHACKPVPGCQTAKLSTQAITSPMLEDTVLVRDFIHSALYDEKDGYFAARSDAVGALPEPLNFSRFEGRRAYSEYLANVYKQGGSSWFTPVELFQPHYANAIAKYILRTHGSVAPLNIYEIGGGTGTCARNIIDYMKKHAPQAVYDTMSYTSVEISGALAKKQYEKVVEGDSRRKQFRVECRNASDRSGWGAVDRGLSIIIMLEVLDNLPHDLVCRQAPENPWMEMRVSERDYSGKRIAPVEIPSPLEDSLIRRCFDAMKDGPAPPGTSLFRSIKDRLLKTMNVPELVWVPTGCLQLLETLHSARPNMVLIASDFSSLPDVSLAGQGAPLVASKISGQTKDHTTYLEAKGHADIFFPTDFSTLRKLDLSCAAARNINTSRHTSILTTAEFMDIFADTEKTLTRDGYNPLLEDFKNTRFYLSTPLRQG
ncbi:unnamed protein product [Calypogeia fissa]